MTLALISRRQKGNSAISTDARDSNEPRKRIADELIRCAHLGKRSVIDLQGAGMNVLAVTTNPIRGNWLGPRRQHLKLPARAGAEGKEMKPYPTHRQREALQILIPGDWMPLLKLLPIGDKALATLLQRGWIERSPDMHAGNLYRVTEAGRTAFRTLVPIR